MAIPCHIDYPTRLIVGYVPADATSGDILETIDASSRDSKLNDFDVLTIFEDLNRVVGETNVFQNELRLVSDKLINRYGIEGEFKAAYVVSKDVDFGLLRMFTTYRGRKIRNSELFFDVREALVWLGLDQPEISALLSKVEVLRQQTSGD